MSDDLRRVTELDRLIHEPARLLIVTILSSVESADFLFLQRETGLTKGNLCPRILVNLKMLVMLKYKKPSKANCH